MRGGGVALYASRQLAVKRCHDLESDNVELLWDLNLLCGVCCRPPNNTMDALTQADRWTPRVTQHSTTVYIWSCYHK